ncbi:Anti sigma-E protein RseA [Salinisphaera sp. PC39]|uniref:sigma-E factor negative regulatory protein n=1 Tax=Salinisphaera sp. PC39 TaxID=1304156 RepID=UPI00333FA4F7
MIDERFSAYLDGEASPSEAEAVLSEMGRDPGLRAAWGRQQWLRSALRDVDTEAAYDPGFAERVARAIDDAGESPARADRVVSFPARRRWRTAASLAAAASVVGAVLLVAEPLGRDSSGMPDAGGTTLAGDDAGVPAVAVSGTPAGETRAAVNVARSNRAADHWSVSDPAVEDQLNGYLLEHNGLARGYGMSGATPSFLRVATYGQDTQR